MSQLLQLVLCSVHWSVSPAFLSDHMPLWRIMSNGKMNPDNTAAFILVSIGVSSLSLWQTQPVRSSSLFLALLFVSPFYLPPLLFQTIHWRAEVKQIITSTDWWPKPGNRITVTIDPAVNLFFTAKGARTRLFLLLAGKAQCYPSSFLCWLLPLILILLSVSVQ